MGDIAEMYDYDQDDRHEIFTVKYDFICQESEKAIEFSIDEKDIWIPKSQIHHHDLNKETIDIPQWLVEDKELEDYCED